MLLTVFALTASVLAAEPAELLRAEGELVLFDGASLFIFKSDGSFEPRSPSRRRWAAPQ